MTLVKCISGDPEYVEGALCELISSGWEIMDLTTNLYQSSSGNRKETTVYLKKITE